MNIVAPSPTATAPRTYVASVLVICLDAEAHAYRRRQSARPSEARERENMNRCLRLTARLDTERLTQESGQTLLVRGGERFRAGWIKLVTSIKRDEVNVSVRDGEPLDGDPYSLGRGDRAQTRRQLR